MSYFSGVVIKPLQKIKVMPLHTEIKASSFREIKGAELDRSVNPSWGYVKVGGIQVIEITRQGNNKNTAGGWSTVGYKLEGSDIVFKSIKKLIES